MSTEAFAGRGGGEAAKIAAFVRRDLLIALSYRTAFVADALQLCAQLLLFGLIGRLVDPGKLPSYGGEQTGYLEFVVIGIVLSLVFALVLERVSTAIRTEQMIGTLETLLVMPVRTATLQVGAVAFDALQVPLRLGLFLALIAATVGLELDAGGILPSIVVLAAFVPFVWGIGLVAAGAIVTFRRGEGVTRLAAMGLGITSGAYFPLSVLPGWAETILSWSPMALALEGLRAALIGGDGWSAVGADVVLLVPLSAISLAVGVLAFRAAVIRERSHGTLGMY